MESVSPIGRSVREEMTEQARSDLEVRAELERLRPFEEVARQILHLRMDHGLSQEALAERVGTTKSAISRLESGQHAPNLATLEKVAAAFGGHMQVGFTVPEGTKVHRELTPA
jgi:DNA-binding XRE family transcriptional regulator